MKKTLLIVSVLIISLFGSSVEGPQNQIVIVGAFKTEQYAQRQAKRLSSVMNSDPEIVRLQEEGGFEYLTKPSGNYFVVAIEPLNGTYTIERVLAAAKKVFPDAYVHIRKHVSQEEKTTPTPEPVVIEKEPAPAAAVSQTAPVDEPAAAEAVPAAPVAVEEKVSRDIPAPAAPKKPSAPAPADDMLLYGGAGAVLLILLLLVLMRKRAKAAPVAEKEEAAEVIAEQAAEAEETVMEAAVAAEEAAVREAIEEVVEEELAEGFEEIETAVSEAVAEEPEAPAGELEEAKAVVPEAAEEAAVEEPEALAAAAAPELSRKKREPRPDRGKITKDDFCDFKGERLLVAEDNLINQKVIVKMLADSGIEIVVANDGQEALDILAKDSDYRLILMDAHMPNVDGFEATRAIRANPAYDHIAISALSGDVGADDIRKMQECGMEAQLEKPLRMEPLYDVMYTYFNLEGEEPAGEASAPIRDESEELHTEEGLDISGGDKTLYMEILHEFVQMYGGSDEVISGYLENNDHNAANALLLDIGGIAANIGADQLADTAGKFREALLANDEDACTALNQSYKEHLRALLVEIDKLK